ncbi:MAG: helix-turn-helix domain-containing protein [Chloroflexota bacterium]|nr:helix-turn-helix domain-containing protein [Chloroflexota bacterium]
MVPEAHTAGKACARSSLAHAHGSVPGPVAELGPEWLIARRTHAFNVGEELALQRIISADAYLFLYKELVRLCKHRTYCWAGVDWLAQRLQSSSGTVKRWLTQLVNAGLIRRMPRPGGDTALTTIVALVAYDAAQQAQMAASGDGELRQADDREPTVVSAREPSLVDTLFFAPEQQIRDESSDGSSLSHHTIKKPDLNVWMVGTGLHEKQRSEIADTPTTRRLLEAGVDNRAVLQELSAKPVAEIAAVCRYVAAQPNSFNPPGLIVELSRQGFGARLLRRHRSGQAQPGVPVSRLEINGNLIEQKPVLEDPAIGARMRPGAYVELWTRIQVELAQQMPHAEFDTWIKETYLAALTNDRAFIGTPNVFARDKLAIDYRDVLVHALQVITGQTYSVEVVIG